MKAEREIETAFIEKLRNLKYIYREDIRDKASLEANFKEHFERLNRVKLSNSEFERLRDSIITADVFTAARTLREINTFKRDDDTPLQYTLVNIKDWCKNEFEVVNQLRINTDNSNHRYDVIILINGVPVVQVELKSLQITPKKAMEQIIEYKNDQGNGYTNSLLCFMQLFIVSNESNTYYFANNHKEHFCFNADERFLPIYQMADEDNNKITHLHDFSDNFLPKCTLGQLISRYMVLVVSEQKLMIMRPYQIYAVKAIMDCIDQNRGNGYIWHTTGSGKTLTSFKTSTLLKDNPEIEKCLFVVDRKDLDRQTRLEFNKFQEGCVEENTNTESLVNRLTSDDYRDKVIVTTIQKLGLALNEDSKRNQEKKKRGEPTYKDRLAQLTDKRIAIIFDECHRSQFGDNHEAIKNFFPKAQLFGFTGTPIFEENATYKQIDGTVGSYITTKDVFEKELHAYTITNAIDDRNVLRFHIDYFKPEDVKKAAKASDTVSKKAIVEAILAKHDAATNGRRYNAIFATASINDAIEYFEIFKSLQEERKKNEGASFKSLNIACVFSPPAEGNKDVKQLQEDLQQEKADNEQEPDKKKAALKSVIDDYNLQYGTNHSINEFDLYYQDVQKRIKDQKYPNSDYPQVNKIDITIVVDMLLTGFDSKYLNTLYVDKNLKQHGLIQAFSRTNRVLNDTKPYGNILDFRGQEKDVDEAIALFSGKENSSRAKEIWLVDPAPVVVEKLDKAVADLEQFMESQGLECKPEQVSNLKGDAARGEFINKFKEVQRLKTQLDQYTDIKEEQEAKIEELLPEDTLRAFRGVYIETAQMLKAQQGKDIRDKDPVIEQIDFEFVLFSSAIIDYDYIMSLISRYTQPDVPKKEKMSREQLISLLCSNSNMMEEREDIIAYISTLESGKGLDEKEIKAGYQKFKEEKAVKEMESIANKHGIEPVSLQAFIDEIIERMIFDGEKLSDLLEPLELGWRDRTKKELELMDELIPLFKKLAGGRVIVGLNAYE
ncbi:MULTISPECIES: type I restriction endonuclease subunit R [Bacillus]|uniref:type I restriction endonuclease subunit R n=1 Tax=Bacillus TaxID=1386 RepID=UPI0005394792|nr:MULTISPECIES: type I restriction endonuclease subunit R [Bacillus]KAF6698088.1 type I restriction endonuclease subunit R [Bacillus sp. EKM501B]MEB9543650.1 type I restriction endonuclease subunit R [Bacillus cereus]MEB9830720.1 type I restriction endonuclease subunit R [Bacillus cereus]PFQ06672.1 DEAD/DEAH box helicase [Bacillus cereus]PGK21441.1 DEAD/DEAH box helicase [Bacillus cereus]